MDSDDTEVNLTFKVTKVRKDTRWRRLVRFMSKPERVAASVVGAWISAWFSYHHHVNFGDYWIAFGSWTIGWLVLFYLYELNHWAGGSKRLD